MATVRTVKDVSPHEFVKTQGLLHSPQAIRQVEDRERLRIGTVEVPSMFKEQMQLTNGVKTATFKELAPYDPD